MQNTTPPLSPTPRHWVPVAGLLGTSFLLLCIIITMSGWGYEEQRYPFSIFNHFISELGTTRKSPLFFIFSAGVCVAGFCNIFLVIELSKRIEGKISQSAKIIGVLASIACILVGLLPGDLSPNFLRAHLFAAMIFFFGSMIAVALFAIALFLSKTTTIPKWHILPSIFMVINGAIFLAIPNDELRKFLELKDAYNRPDFWAKPFFEWMVLFSLAFWLFLSAWHLYKQQKG